jgi:WD40 repeat protein
MLIHSQSLRTIILAAMWLFLPTLAIGQVDKKTPAPNAGDQEPLRAKLNMDFQDDLAKARTDPQTAQKLVDLFLGDAAKAKNDTVKHFVLTNFAIDVAARSGDIGSAFWIIEELAETFAFDPEQRKYDALALVATASTEDYLSLVDMAQGVVTSALDRDDFALAGKANLLAEDFAKKAKELALVVTIQRERKGIAATEAAFNEYKPFFARLENDPADAEANLKKGQFLALHKGDWNTGLFYLAQGNDPKLRLLAQRDLIKPTDPKEQRTIADSWWNLANDHDGQIKVHVQQRAAHWYEHMSYSLTGQEFDVLQERIAAVPPARKIAAAWDYFGKPGMIENLGRHTSSIFGVDFSPDGRMVLSGCINRNAILWDVKNGKQLHNINAHLNLIWSVAFDPQGRYFFTAGADGFVKMWETRTGKEIRQFVHPNRITFTGLDVSSDGRKLATGSQEGIVRIWDIKTAKVLKQMQGHQGAVYGIAFSPDGRYVLSGGANDRKLILWDTKTGKELKQLQGILGQIRNVAISPDGRYAVGSGETSTRLWDLKTGNVVRQFKGHTGQVFSLDFSPDAKRLITGATDNTIRYWDVASGKQLHVFTNVGGVVYDVAFSPGGGRVVSGGSDNTVRLWGLPR